ncbi:MAG: hypothetical protein RJA22_2746 [Verrucomicrobiota bacterium]
MRLLSIDLLRTLAIILMVLVHFVENLSGTPTGTWWLPSGFAAPVFTLLTGVSYRLWLEAEERRGRSDAEISKRTVRRGLFLLATGFAFNIVVWLPPDVFNWDVLTFIGAALLVLNGVRRLPPGIPALIAVMSFLLGPLLRAVSDYPAYWEQGYFEADFTLPEVARGFLAVGYFPLFPWLLYPVLGFGVAGVLFPQGAGLRPDFRRPALAGAILLGAAALALAVRPACPPLVRQHLLQGWTMFPPTVPYVLSTLGVALLALTLARRGLDGRPDTGQPGALAVFAGTFSRHSLSIYVLHHVAHLWPLWICGVAAGKESTHYWQQALPVPVSFLLAWVFLVLCYGLFRWMDRRGWGGLERWMRWVCD